MGGFLSRFSAHASLAMRWVAAIGLVLITAVIAWQVFARYVLNASPAWAEQVALLVMIWFVFLAAAAGVREGFHIRIAAFADALKPGPRRVVHLVAHAVVAVFGLALAWWGVELSREVWSHVIPTLGISRGWAYVPMPVSGVLVFFFAVEHGIHELRGSEVPPQWN